ncbi:MAG: helix-turn-helix domain-containing protein, partial [Thermodesulfobacteriota bacterium]
MERPGEYLKRERELRGIVVADLSTAIKLSATTINAIEADDYAKLPHSAYVRGFIRAYAKHLGLDDDDCAIRYEAYLRELDEKEREKTKPHRANAGESAEKRQGRRLTYIISFAGAAVLVIIVVSFYFTLFNGKEAKEATVSAPAASVPEGKQAAAVPDVSVKPDAAIDAPVKPQAVKPLPAKEVKPEVKSVEPSTPVPAAPEAATESNAEHHTLEMFAKQPTWVKVSIDDKEP